MTTVASSFLNRSFSFLQVAIRLIKAWMSLNFDHIPSPNTELASLERLKNVMYNHVTTLDGIFVFDQIFSNSCSL